MQQPVDLIYISLYVSRHEKKYYILASLEDVVVYYKIEITQETVLELSKQCNLAILPVKYLGIAEDFVRVTPLSANKKLLDGIVENKLKHIEGRLALYYSTEDQAYYVHFLIAEPQTVKLYFEIKETDVKSMSRSCFIDIHPANTSLRPLAS